MCLGPSCTVLYSAPANYRVVHLVIFIAKGPSIYYVIPDRGGGVCPIYYNIT